MKFLIAIILLNMGKLYAQNGYSYIQSASKKIEKKKYTDALYQLSLAESSDYGFCGNAWASAIGDIKILRSKIYMEQGFYDRALAELSTIADCNFGADCETADSLKVEILIRKHGKEKVASAFKNENSYIRNTNSMGTIRIKLKEINEIFSFYFFINSNFEKRHFDFLKENHQFNEFIKDYSFYKLIE